MSIKSYLRNLLDPPVTPLELVDSPSEEAYRNFVPVFAVGTGRSGTHFMNKVMESDETFMSMHTDGLADTAMDSFIRYAQWYGLDLDLEPVRHFRHRLIATAADKGRIYFESNAYLSSVASHLHDWFGARVILLIRRPQDVVNSHFIKGWYEEWPHRADPFRPPSYPGGMPANHFFGRILPMGDDYRRWEGLTRIGRISWWWNTLNLHVYRAFEAIPETHRRVVRVESFDYEGYRDLHAFAGGRSLMSEEQFEDIRARRPGKGRGRRTVDSWTDQEWQEFMQETAEAREVFGYTDISR